MPPQDAPIPADVFVDWIRDERGRPIAPPQKWPADRPSANAEKVDHAARKDQQKHQAEMNQSTNAEEESKREAVRR
jgi:hypothetical protein